MQVRFKKLNDLAVTPTKANTTDAGFDLVATNWAVSDDYSFVEYGTGIAVEIPAGHVGYIFPRSSISRVDQLLTNSVGVIDSGYRGEIRFRFRSTCTDKSMKYYHNGDKIGQLVIMPIPEIELVEVDELSASDRGENGFGSSGK